MNKSQPNAPSNQLTPGTVLVMGAALVIAAVFLWAAYGAKYSSLMGKIRRYEMAVFAQFSQPAEVLHGKLVELNGRPLNFQQTRAMLGATGQYVRWLFIPPLAVFAFWTWKRSYRRRYSTKHTMKSLARSQVEIWPEISPVVDIMDDLVAGDIRKGRWAVRATEWEFAVRHGLAKRGGSLDREKAHAVFNKQLGMPWTGPHQLPPHLKGLFAALLLRIGGERDKSTAAFRAMAVSMRGGDVKKLDISFADDAIKKHLGHPLVQRILNSHAFVYTVMATALQVARADGVLASTFMTWVRPVDRRLWYTLNGVGRQTPCVEWAGIFAHWVFEKSVKRMCVTPMTQKAVDGLAEALADYTEDDSVDRLFA